MRVVATHTVGENEKDVIIVDILLEGENYKAAYYNTDGEIDVDDIANFTVTDTFARIAKQ